MRGSALILGAVRSNHLGVKHGRLLRRCALHLGVGTNPGRQIYREGSNKDNGEGQDQAYPKEPDERRADALRR
jgi:hypothetical protein